MNRLDVHTVTAIFIGSILAAYWALYLLLGLGPHLT